MTDEGNSQGIYMIVFKVDLPFAAEYIDKKGSISFLIIYRTQVIWVRF